MRTAYIVKGHIDATGTIVLDEPAPVPPGAVLVTIQTIDEHQETPAVYNSAERGELADRIAAIAALVGPPPPDDGLTARDYKHILYGTEDQAADER
jgi:hypothetical protein